MTRRKDGRMQEKAIVNGKNLDSSFNNKSPEAI